MKTTGLFLLLIIFASATVSAQTIPAVTPFKKVPEPTRNEISAVYSDYLLLKNALVSTDEKTAITALGKLNETVKKLDSKKLEGEQRKFLMKESINIKKTIIKMNNPDLAMIRENFQPIAVAVFSLVKGFSAMPETVYLQYCPMALNNEGALWLSEKKNILNPYFGDKMLKCGSVKETLVK
jgi:hypothetical protein